MLLTSLGFLLHLVSSAVAVEVDAAVFSRQAFDYIVVGGGTTGLAVAMRLSDDPGVTVGIIEAGEHKEDNNILIPGLIGSTLGNPEYDWLLSTIPQVELKNRIIGLGRGKLLGGTSALNFFGYQRASVNEYDGWEALGNKGWNFETMLPFMKRAEKWTPPSEFFVDEFLANDDVPNHGVSGSVLTTPYANYSNLVPPFFSSLQYLGVSPNKASHGGHTVGMWSITATMDPRNRTRSYSANAYYEPVADRLNLILLTRAEALDIQLSDNGGNSSALHRATHVRYIGQDNITRTAYSRREIILSCGSIKNPQILELSGTVFNYGPKLNVIKISAGIGNATLLQQLNIPVLIDLPGVGENLQDHPGVTADFETFDNMTTWDELSDPTIGPEQFQQYVYNRTGLYSAVASTVAFLPWSQFMRQDYIEQLKNELDSVLSSDSRYFKSTFALQRRWLEDDTIPQLELILFPQNSNAGTGNAVSGKKFYTVSALFEHTWSRGSVHVTNRDGQSAPMVDLRYLESPADIDLKVFVQALRYAQKVSQTEPLRSLTTAVLGPSLNATDDELIEWTRQHLSTNFHLIGTAAMLPREAGGVVDPSLTVYGTANLRIVDASIYPIHIATHPVGTLYGLGERAAELITAARG